MSSAAAELVGELLAESLAAWHVAGSISRADDGGIVVLAASGKKIRVDPSQQRDMFRWLVTIDGRQRPAVSLVAVLRQIRQALDPGYAARRVRITVAPLVPS